MKREIIYFSDLRITCKQAFTDITLLLYTSDLFPFVSSVGF